MKSRYSVCVNTDENDRQFNVITYAHTFHSKEGIAVSGESLQQRANGHLNADIATPMIRYTSIAYTPTVELTL